jgi:hypothetical protein
VSRDPSDLAAELVRLERENHRLRCDLADALREGREADARARTWRRIAQWIHDAHQPDTEERP